MEFSVFNWAPELTVYSVDDTTDMEKAGNSPRGQHLLVGGHMLLDESVIGNLMSIITI